MVDSGKNTNHRICCICKYTPIELIAAFGGEAYNLDEMPEGFDLADQIVNPNICGFGKALLQAVMAGDVKELVLVNCCDTIRSVYDILADSGKLDFLYMIDMLHSGWTCSRERVADQLVAFAKAYRTYMGNDFSEEKFRDAFHAPGREREPYISVLGARMGRQLFEMVQDAMPLPVQNDSCVHNRSVGEVLPPRLRELDGQLSQNATQTVNAQEAEYQADGSAKGVLSDKDSSDEVAFEDVNSDAEDILDSPAFHDLMLWYAGELMRQVPCMRMMDKTGRKALYNDPNLRGIIYHTIKFCDFYSFEYADIKQNVTVPMLKIESDYTTSASGQLATRLEAFAETMDMQALKEHRASAGTGVGAGGAGNGALGSDGSDHGFASSEKGSFAGNGSVRGRNMTAGYFAGIDSGSTSTDVAIIDRDGNIKCGIIVPTGAGASNAAEKALEEALKKSGLTQDDIAATVTTGYGRTAITIGDKSITEITCHARGAHFLEPSVRTVIDIGGQDSKVIRLDADGNVTNFVMNDKCAAGTGRFLEMMAHSLEMSLDEMSKHGLKYDEDITISSMCTVFAESEVVSLIAQNKTTDDIVHGINKSVAVKTNALVKRVGGEPVYMMTGGVSKNAGLVKTLSETLGSDIIIRKEAQLNGAIGAALYARDLA